MSVTIGEDVPETAPPSSFSPQSGVISWNVGRRTGVGGGPRARCPTSRRFLLSVILFVCLPASSRVAANRTSDAVTPDWIFYSPPASSSLREDGGGFSASSQQDPVIFSDQWAVHVTGGAEKARQLARLYGFEYINEIMEDYYLLRHRRAKARSKRSSDWLHKDLLDDPNIHWTQQQVVKHRAKRDHSVARPAQSAFGPDADAHFNDPEWQHMWYLNRGEGLDMNVQKAWQMGYTGQGVVVTILDDGLEKDHPDISINYDARASYDVNGNDEDPQPRYDSSNTNRHGTRCAGEVAAQANNSNCVVGIAFNARIGGVRMLDGDVTDAVEAQSVGLNPQHIDIYSASWGPDDDGRTVDGPAFLTKRAFVNGVLKGRRGLGSIFVWASGNGGRDGDSCNCDGYTNSIQTLSISSATDNGKVPWYLEKCSSTMATTYSSGSSMERQILTTDLHHKCTASHTGTSASAPLAAGIVALALEANPKLTWRDVQHLVVRTARHANLDAEDWVTNGVGRNISHSFGYGLMDALAMVKIAKDWIRVGDHHRCMTTYPNRNMRIPSQETGSLILTLNTEGCKGAAQHVQYLEHVQAQITLSAAKRGDVEIYLTSPQGTRSMLLQQRPRDNNRQGFHQWPFMSVFFWGEKSYGNWTLEVKNKGKFGGWGTLYDWALVMYGTEELPMLDQIMEQNRLEQENALTEPASDLASDTTDPSDLRLAPSAVTISAHAFDSRPESTNLPAPPSTGARLPSPLGTSVAWTITSSLWTYSLPVLVLLFNRIFQHSKVDSFFFGKTHRCVALHPLNPV
ncbi:Furin-like protease 1, isoforms 1/1-X/2 [Hypsibius exemplaris]|uniref:Furin-like protease 1, isoforms 1/1-X/2 n=1 Tax=Hypsibius exemplaris TaxID=2072580 RepID=A0A9X6NM57_HYPEX|nr:Furin-like protease 1, isoforms 1/1-X/2 [Hypsibius exemplaris]